MPAPKVRDRRRRIGRRDTGAVRGGRSRVQWGCPSQLIALVSSRSFIVGSSCSLNPHRTDKPDRAHDGGRWTTSRSAPTCLPRVVQGAVASWVAPP